MNNKYAVLGDPIDHSWSPFIHKSFAKQFALSFEYEKIKVAKGTLSHILPMLLSRSYLGFNITVPLKQEAYKLAILKKWHLSERAVKAESINTLLFRNNEVVADNTDGVGLFRNLEHHGIAKITNGNVLILGAGGAARGILPMFQKKKFRKVTVVNRGISNLEQLSAIFRSEHFDYLTIDNLNAQFTNSNHIEGEFLKFDLIINATSASIGDININIPNKLFAGCPLAVDLFYSSEPTLFMKFASMSGAKNVVDGLGMLVEQAAESFYIWTNYRPSTNEILKTIRFEMLNK